MKLANIAGKLLTDQQVVLACGLVAIGTHPGWTLIGKTLPDEVEHSNSSISVTTSMFFNEESIVSLWDLDIIRIKDPVQNT